MLPLLLREDQTKRKEATKPRVNKRDAPFSKIERIAIAIGCISVIPLIYVIGRTVKYLFEAGLLNF